MSNYCKIEGMDCEFVLGDNMCLVDKTCKDMNEWLTEHDVKVRADAIDEFAEKILEMLPNKIDAEIHNGSLCLDICALTIQLKEKSNG